MPNEISYYLCRRKPAPLMVQKQDNQHIVLSADQVKQKIRRIAFEIYENNFRETQLVLVGIEKRGFLLAQHIERELEAIAPLTVSTVHIKQNRNTSLFDTMMPDYNPKKLRKKCIILVDDVLNTGKTLAFAMNFFLSIEVKKIEIAVLVNRSHTLFPIQPKYTGLELATTLNNHVEVFLGKKTVVYLR